MLRLGCVHFNVTLLVLYFVLQLLSSFHFLLDSSYSIFMAFRIHRISREGRAVFFIDSFSTDLLYLQKFHEIHPEVPAPLTGSTQAVPHSW